MEEVQYKNLVARIRAKCVITEQAPFTLYALEWWHLVSWAETVGLLKSPFPRRPSEKLKEHTKDPHRRRDTVITNTWGHLPFLGSPGKISKTLPHPRPEWIEANRTFRIYFCWWCFVLFSYCVRSFMMLPRNSVT